MWYLYLLGAAIFLTWGIGLEVYYLLTEPANKKQRISLQCAALIVTYISLVFIHLAATN